MMKPFFLTLQCKARFAFVLAVTAGVAVAAGAQAPQARIVGDVRNETRAAIAGSMPARALPANDTGRVASGMQIAGATIVFNRSVAQQAALETLLAAQQDPASAQYHQWLGPDEFATRFGMSDADLEKVRGWLESQGLVVDAVGRGRDRLTFSGTAAQIEAAFQTEMHTFKAAGDAETHFAPASDLTVPAAFAGSVLTVANLSSFRARPHVRQGPAPGFNSGQSSSHFLTPGDVATVYDIKAAYNAGYTGAGQSIAVAGQSAIIASDVTNFQSASGLPQQAPTMVLMPGTGTSTIYSGDEAESDLDVEYAGGIAKGATIYLVYAGSSPNYGVFEAAMYAITNRIAPIVSVSYGECETALGQAGFDSYAAIFQQAAAQGQTLVASSGDDGSTDCYQFTSLTQAQRQALAVDFPASSPYVTGLGGSEFLAADVTTTNTTYWAANTGTDIINSALSYIPEMAWNDDSSTVGLSSGGGGVSALAARPTYQSSSVPGIAAISGSGRLVPDISLSSSPNNAGYLYCSSDTGSTSIQGSCSHGFRDANSTYLTVAGGTSFAAPIFAGMLAIINQATKSTGQGQVNPTLYSLASSSATYAAAFHDITSGTNECTAGASYCTSVGLSAYAAGTGYDQATGLGSVDLNRLIAAWPVASGGTGPTGTTMTLTPATTVPKLGATDTITIAVGPGTTASGTVSVSVNGGTATTATLTNGVATYSFSASVAGQYVVVATYAGSSTYGSSTATLLLQVGGTGTFTLAAAATTITAGNTGSSTVTVTAANGYTGTVNFTVTASPVISNACYTVTPAAVTGATATGSISIITNAANCTTGTTTLYKGKLTASNTMPDAPSDRRNRSEVPVGLAFAGLLMLGLVGRRSRALRSLVAVALLAVAAFGLSGCGNGTVTSTNIGSAVVTNYAAKGSYTIVVQGTDSATTSNTAYAQFTLTVQ